MGIAQYAAPEKAHTNSESAEILNNHDWNLLAAMSIAVARKSTPIHVNSGPRENVVANGSCMERLTLELSGGCPVPDSLPQPTRSRPLERTVRAQGGNRAKRSSRDSS